MPLYVADYLRDTRRLTTPQHGAYLLLIMEYWTAGGLPSDDGQLARVVGMSTAEWRKAKPIVQAFFHDGWKHQRIDDEIAKAVAKHERRSEAGKRGGIASATAKQNSSNAVSNAQASSSQPQSERKEEDPADAGSSKVYAFETGVIKLNQRDFDRWKAAFSYLDLAAELVAMAPWAEQQASWFHAVPNALRNRNRDAKAAKEKQQQNPFKWNGIEGVI